MSKAILEFNLPEEQEEFDKAVKGGAAHYALFDVGQQVFRPARKHGYPDPTLSELLSKLDALVAEHAPAEWPVDEYGKLNATDLIQLLERKFYEIVNEQDLEV